MGVSSFHAKQTVDIHLTLWRCSLIVKLLAYCASAYLLIPIWLFLVNCLVFDELPCKILSFVSFFLNWRHGFKLVCKQTFRISIDLRKIGKGPRSIGRDGFIAFIQGVYTVITVCYVLKRIYFESVYITYTVREAKWLFGNILCIWRFLFLYYDNSKVVAAIY